MENKIRFSLIIILLFSFVISGNTDNLKPQWKGKIEYENGVKVIKNPKEPLYGEIVFELEEDLSIGNEEDENYAFYKFIKIEVDNKENIYVLDSGNCRIQKFDKEGNYLQTIGRKGQGPGEFGSPYNIYLDSDGNIYINELVGKLHKFDENGKFVRSIKSFYIRMSFSILEDEKILAQNSSLSGGREELLLLNSEGEKLETIASYSPKGKPHEVRESEKRGTLLGVWGLPRYSFILHPLKEKFGIFAYSGAYRLNLVKSPGEIELIIEKDESPIPFPDKEKNGYIDSYIKSAKKHGMPVSRRKAKDILNLPDYKPFFEKIITDDEGNLYVLRSGLSSGKEKRIEVDIFNKEGHYIYNTTLPFQPKVIRNGYIYGSHRDPEHGYLRIKRYKIKNWDKIKWGI